jgi:hypothetical protein
VLIQTTLTFRAEDGSAARFQASFAAFTDPKAADMSVLGRDVLEQVVAWSGDHATTAARWRGRETTPQPGR